MTEQARSDTALIRHIARTHGVEVAREWQQPPLLTLPEVAVEDLLSHADGTRNRADLEHLPWEDVVLDVGSARRLLPIVTDDELALVGRHAERSSGDARLVHNALRAMRFTPAEAHRGPAFIRVRLLASALETSLSRTSPWLSQIEDDTRAQGDADGLILVEAWDSQTVRGNHLRRTTAAQAAAAIEAGETGWPLWPDVVLVDRYTLQQRHLYTGSCRERAHGVAWCHLARCVRDRNPEMNCLSGVGILSQAARLAAAVMSVFIDPPVYVVEKRNAPGQLRDRARMAKTARLKPWLRNDLPSLILIDPSRVADYGHPATVRHDDRSSPRLHPRRGHWRTLHRGEDDERKTWVRPAWIGADAWDHQGAHYQLAQMPAAVAIRRARGEPA